MKIFFLSLLVLISMNLYSNEEHDHEEQGHEEKSRPHDEEKSHGDDHNEEQKLPGGVTSFEDESGEFSLKEKVIQNFGILLGEPVFVNGILEVPESAIVRSLKETSIFVQKGDRFKSVPVKILNFANGKVRVSGVMNDVKIVLKGNNFLKTILLSLEEGPSEGHGH